MALGSSETKGTRKKSPIAPRKRSSFTLPESITCATHEPPLRFCASSVASSCVGTPPASNRSIIDWLAGDLIAVAANRAATIPCRFFPASPVLAHRDLSLNVSSARSSRAIGTYRGWSTSLPAALRRSARCGRGFLTCCEKENQAAEFCRDKECLKYSCLCCL